jgi:uncharacterized protein
MLPTPFIRFAVASVMLALLSGCGTVNQWFFGVQATDITAENFSRDPLVRQLAIAVEQHDEPAVKAAVSQGADVNSFGAGGFRLLYWAMVRNKSEGFETLIKYGADFNADYRDVPFLPDRSYRRSVLRVVLESDSRECLKALLRHGVSPDYAPQSEDGMSLICFAGRAGSVSVIEALLEAGADINRRDAAGYTPLVRAMMGCEYNTAWLFLRRGADPTIKDYRGKTFADSLKQYGSRGVRADHQESFDAIVAELVSRGLITHQDIMEANKPKRSILKEELQGMNAKEFSPGSGAGNAILRLDETEGVAHQRD